MAFGADVTHLLDLGDGQLVQIVLALRVADVRFAMPEHQPGTCSRCAEAVIFPAAAPPQVPVVCMQCTGWGAE